MSAREGSDERTASRYGAALLRALGHSDPAPTVPSLHPAHSAADCGLLALTGPADGAPLVCPAPLAAAADGALAALAALAPAGAFDELHGRALLTERAAIFGHGRGGRSSPGGSCRLVDTRDGAVALNLARDDDWTLLSALFERDMAADWPAVEAAAATMTMHDLVERGRELGLAVAPVVPAPSQPPTWFSPLPQAGAIHSPLPQAGAIQSPLPQAGEGQGGRAAPQAHSVQAARATLTPTLSSRARGERGTHRPRVLDLSSLWAGPLCGHLLQRCGAEVVKLESTRRPDGARNGPAEFFNLMNAGKRSVALDFASNEGRRLLHALIARADIVIEASRPRALRQLGLDAEALVRERPLTWISLSGYGRGEPQEHWIAYGDDAGVAGGLAYLMRRVHGAPVFVGDAIADPLAGLHAALAAWAGWRAGGGGLVSIALVDVVRHIVRFEAPSGAAGWRQRAQAWAARVGPDDIGLPQARVAASHAAPLGTDTQAVLADWNILC
jgi:hypothetical protein